MSDLTGQLQQIRESVDAIEEMLGYNNIADPTLLFVEPRVGGETARPGPSIDLGCSEHDWFRILFPWGGGGRVSLADLIEAVREHLKASH